MLGTEVSVMNAEANGMEPVSKTQELCEKLYLAAKRSETRRFHALFDKVYRMDFLEEAWEQVKKNKGKPGVDDESIVDIEQKGVQTVLSEIQQALKEKRYRPRKVKRVNIPKHDGTTRALGIPTVRDRIVQASTKRIIEPIFEADFLECSYGFRPNRSAHDALEAVRRWTNGGYDVVLDADIKGFFDNIDHARLLEQVHHRINDRRVLKLIRKWLKCGVMEDGVAKESDMGTPQGGVISPLLANIYLHELDMFWTQQTRVDGKLIRYADDFVILFRSERDAAIGMHLARLKLQELGLELNEDKTHTVKIQGGRDGFDFLGFHHRQMMSSKHRRPFTQKWPGAKSMNALRSKIRGFLGNRAIRRWALDDVLGVLNPILRGWMNYFRYGNSALKFDRIDRYVHERLALWWRKKRGKGGRGWGNDFTWDKFKVCGVQLLCGSIRYWTRELNRKPKEEGHRKAV
jgi:group II intron reverse transcriptase/maturase